MDLITQVCNILNPPEDNEMDLIIKIQKKENKLMKRLLGNKELNKNWYCGELFFYDKCNIIKELILIQDELKYQYMLFDNIDREINDINYKFSNVFIESYFNSSKINYIRNMKFDTFNINNYWIFHDNKQYLFIFLHDDKIMYMCYLMNIICIIINNNDKIFVCLGKIDKLKTPIKLLNSHDNIDKIFNINKKLFC